MTVEFLGPGFKSTPWIGHLWVFGAPSDAAVKGCALCALINRPMQCKMVMIFIFLGWLGSVSVHYWEDLVPSYLFEAQKSRKANKWKTKLSRSEKMSHSSLITLDQINPSSYHIHIHIHIQNHTCTRIRLCICVCMCWCLCVCVCVCVYVCLGLTA